jgi:hypothetical protein
VCARQLGFGQMPIGIDFSDLIKPLEIIPSGTYYQHPLDQVPNSATVDLDSWRFSGFSSPLFNIWWAEWCDHLFYGSPRIYCEKQDPTYHASANEVIPF